MERVEVNGDRGMEMSKQLLPVVARHPGLKELMIEDTDLTGLVPQQLAEALARVEKVELVHNPLTPHQLTAICTTVTSSSRLKTLHFYMYSTEHEYYRDFFDLSSVNEDILAQGVTQLEEVVLSAQLTTQQVEAIFAAIDTSSPLKILRLFPYPLLCSTPVLCSVDPGVLAAGINKLEVVDLRRKKLTEEQMTRILTQSLLATNLRELHAEVNGEKNEQLMREAQGVVPQLDITDMSEEDLRYNYLLW